MNTLQALINEKVARIRLIENDLPAVLIIHDIRDWSVVYMSPRGLKELGITLKELQQMGSGYHQRFFNPDEAKDYVPGILGMIERNNTDESVSQFQQVKFAGSNDWVWHASATKILLRDEEGKPVLAITTAIPIDPKHHFSAKVQRLLDENNFLRYNTNKFLSLTGKEKTVLRLMAMGLSCKEISVEIGTTEATASTHRRNIKFKLGIQNNYEIIQFAQSFNLI